MRTLPILILLLLLAPGLAAASEGSAQSVAPKPAAPMPVAPEAVAPKPVAAEPDAPPRVVPQLGSPARPEAVQAALEAVAAGEADALALARALAGARGVAAAQGLLVLLERRNPEVRVAALLGLARVGLRSDELADAVHEALAGSFRTPKERWAAVVALGAVGDGRDMDALLALTGGENTDRELRTAAFRAMGAITRVRIPFVHARWSYWWRKHAARGTSRVRAAIEALDKDPGGAGAVAHEAALSAYGWIEPEATTAALERWIGGSPRGLEARACRLAAYLRLADLAPAIRSASRRHTSAEVRQASGDALARLGVVHEPSVR